MHGGAVVHGETAAAAADQDAQAGQRHAVVVDALVRVPDDEPVVGARRDDGAQQAPLGGMQAALGLAQLACPTACPALPCPAREQARYSCSVCGSWARIACSHSLVSKCRSAC